VDSVGIQEETGRVWGGLNCCSLAFPSPFFCLLYGGTPAPESCAQRTMEGDGSFFVVADRPRAGGWPLFPLLALFCHISLGDDGFDLLRELNK